ncbi:MAG: type sorting protein [Chitinophagaceae bacterium]|nr:type sorting protein [Chitinophagaceae bacterium]
MQRLLLSLSACLLTLTIYAQTISPYIVTDQLGYRPSAKKIAILRDPVQGYDAASSYTPGISYALIDATNSNPVFTGSAAAWNGGVTDATSGDNVWRFDFSSYTTTGSYYVLDVTNNVRSYEFEIKEDVYNTALKHAVRSFFYQRSGFAKQAPYAETGWVDGASHVGPLQDKQCRIFSAPSDASTQRDVHGGWYDAGDYNKYTLWTGNYIIELLKAYEENPTAWTDDYNLPESANGIPDVLDEVKWGMDYLLRLQNTDGSLISIVGVAHASPPSSATGRSLYGNVNTSGTLKAAAAYAYGSKIFANAGLGCYADSLQAAAQKAWDWCVANPSVVWSNNTPAYVTAVGGVGGGDMEVNDYDRTMFKLEAAVHLYDLTGNTTYKTFFDNNYTTSHLVQWYYTYPFEQAHQETLLYYTKLSGATTSVVNTIKGRYNAGIEGDNSFKAYDQDTDAYKSYLQAYVWGSNGNKCSQGIMLYDVLSYSLNSARNTDATNAAEQYIHYIHGLNPVQKFYLSNFNAHEADNSVAAFYHSWYAHGSALWDKVGVSTYGPAPGYLVGGPNPAYDWNSCCPSGCGSPGNNALCNSIDISKVKGQPDSKAYMDFNESWPIDSWEVTENSCGYQAPYIRLLSKFVKQNGSSPTGPSPCTITASTNQQESNPSINLYPNPSGDAFQLEIKGSFHVNVYTSEGKLLESVDGQDKINFGTTLLPGLYQIECIAGERTKVLKAVKY